MRNYFKAVIVLLTILSGTTYSSRCDAVTITPVSAASNNEFNGSVPAANTINSSGLVAGQHSASVGDNWLTANLGNISGGTWPANLDAVVISWDLGTSYDLTSLHLWNHNEVGNTHRGVASAMVDVSEFSNFSSSTTISLASILQAPGVATYIGTDYSLVATGRYVRFRNMTKFTHPGTGDTNQYLGISEIRFEGTLVPEPSSVLLLGIGGVFMLMRRQRGSTKS